MAFILISQKDLGVLANSRNTVPRLCNMQGAVHPGFNALISGNSSEILKKSSNTSFLNARVRMSSSCQDLPTSL